MSEMALKLQTLWPEIVLTGTAFLVMILGLSPTMAVRRATYGISGAGLLVAVVLAAAGPAMGIDNVPDLALFVKIVVCLIGLALLATVAELPDESEADFGINTRFDPGNASRGEFFGFFLLSLVGAMLCATADDLIWLFLALELTSLPTYVMVATSRSSIRAPEAAVKYFFLGAMSAAIFLYGFTLIYGATGTTTLVGIQESLAAQGTIPPLALTGILLAVVGICFKIAAFPMHFYAADVYEGAATPVAAFLAFTPKAAGFIALILLLTAVGWPLDQGLEGGPGEMIVTLLWVLAAATMFLGNTIALMQSSVKRVLAYSSVAHSGYMLVGLVAGPGGADESGLLVRNGIAALLFYLVAYGVMNLGAFAVLGLLRRAGEEAETFDDLKGLAYRRPGMTAVMAICVLSLIGLPPLVGFWGKLFLLGAIISVGDPSSYILAGILVLNSAIGAFYYLRIVAVCYLNDPTGEVETPALPHRSMAAAASAAAVVVLSIVTAPLIWTARDAAGGFAPDPSTDTPARIEPADPAPLPAMSRNESSDSDD